MKRTKAQKKGDQGETTALFIASKSSDWIVRKVDKDFGVDLEMELVANEYVTGQYVKTQVKGTEQVFILDNLIKFRVKTSFLKYCDECRVPIILLLIDLNHDIGYYIWVQEYLRMHQPDIEKTKSIDVFIPATSDFASGLKNKLKSIAAGLNHTQLQLDLKASLSSAFLLGDQEIYEKLSQLAIDITKTNSLEINRVIDDLIQLGIKAWGTVDGNKKSDILFSFCRKSGDRFSAKQIEKMVVRGSTYSRVGIIALGILYDEYPQHLKTLNLPQIFETYDDDPRIKYYCLLRERYLGRSSLDIWQDPKIDYCIGNLNIREEDRELLYLKWPNRGDSTILDYLTYEKD